MATADRKLRLSDKPRPSAPHALPPWPVLVVDDDEQVHAMTRVLLRDFSFDGRGFSVLSAHSAAEAARLLADSPDIPVVLLDVVMETADAGLKLVRTIRDELGNDRVRIILRTGQPGEAPERDVVLGYDVNDYKSKSELTAQKLFTALVGAVRSWRDIVAVRRLNAELAELNASLEQKVADRTAELERGKDALGRAKELAETALERESAARQQLRQFLSMVSHEFRTPLAIIDSAAQMLLLKDADRRTNSRPRLDTIRGAVRRLVDLIDTCLADEQLESGRMVMNEAVVDLAALLAVTCAAQEGHDRIRVTVSDLPPVWGDPGLLALALNNLVGNALKYSGPDGPVEVAAENGGEGVVVRITDHGIGIPAADLPRIFDRFHRAANTLGVPGSGIGLHMVRQIVELHGGSIEAESAVGQGSTFTLRLRPAPKDRAAQ
ncbi:MAG: ATP-binding protein [Solirubrobacterales bacterium]